MNGIVDYKKFKEMSKEVKLSTITRYLEQHSIPQLSIAWGISRGQILEWKRRLAKYQEEKGQTSGMSTPACNDSIDANNAVDQIKTEGEGTQLAARIAEGWLSGDEKIKVRGGMEVDTSMVTPGIKLVETKSAEKGKLVVGERTKERAFTLGFAKNMTGAEAKVLLRNIEFLLNDSDRYDILFKAENGDSSLLDLISHIKPVRKQVGARSADDY